MKKVQKIILAGFTIGALVWAISIWLWMGWLPALAVLITVPFIFLAGILAGMGYAAFTRWRAEMGG